MQWLARLALVLALGLAPGCMATFSAYDALAQPDDGPSTTGKVVFYALLPVWLAVDVVTAPFQYVYVVTHAR